MARAAGGTQPVVVVSRRGAERLRDGHVWIYRSDVAEGQSIAAGALVLVKEAPSGPPRAPRILGSAFYSSASEIALRMLSSAAVEDLDELLRERIRKAIAYRERTVEHTNAYRLISSEGDFLPGLVVDRYNDILAIQLLTQAMDSDRIRNLVTSELESCLHPTSIVERIEPRVRRLEQLPEKTSALLLGSKQETEFEMNGVRFAYHSLAGQKSGAFLDQRENYRAAERYARGEALDVFCYQGGFALHLARSCARVTGVDSSRPALEMADLNAGLNHREIEWLEANAFDLLRDYASAGRRYDTVVLDPPAFAKSRRHLDAALPAYKELNLRALRMLRPDGLLVTCSCSYHVSPSDFLATVQAAAHDSHRILRVLENRGQSKDHPIVIGVPETAYLKCLILLVS